MSNCASGWVLGIAHTSASFHSRRRGRREKPERAEFTPRRGQGLIKALKPVKEPILCRGKGKCGQQQRKWLPQTQRFRSGCEQ